jgi:hypothetical protein
MSQDIKKYCQENARIIADAFFGLRWADSWESKQRATVKFLRTQNP